MAKPIDLTGQKFGKLTAIERLPGYKKHKTFYKCLCECGNEKNVYGPYLTSGHTKTCGMCDKERPYRRKDRTGEKYGKLTVQKMIYNHKEKNNYCECLCECGKTKVVYPGNLTSGKTKSCGCLEESSRYGRNHKKDLRGMRFGKLVALFPTDKKAPNGTVYWHCQCDCGNFHDVTSGRLLGGRTTSCGCKKYSHREIFIGKCLERFEIDFEREYGFPNLKNQYPLLFDFYLPEYNLCIEYQGELHYLAVEFFDGKSGLELRQYRDMLKKEYCEKNNINLMVLPYTLSDLEIEEKLKSILDPVTTTVA